MKDLEKVRKFAQRVLDESRFDVDTQYCIDNNIKFNNHEDDAKTVSLFTTDSNRAAFEFVSK